jgi:hypothetical protein
MRTNCTLLAALWADPVPAGADQRVADRLARGDLSLTGNFRGQERVVAREFRKIRTDRNKIEKG